jgi:hypothetical protein
MWDSALYLITIVSAMTYRRLTWVLESVATVIIHIMAKTTHRNTGIPLCSVAMPCSSAVVLKTKFL